MDLTFDVLRPYFYLKLLNMLGRWTILKREEEHLRLRRVERCRAAASVLTATPTLPAFARCGATQLTLLDEVLLSEVLLSENCAPLSDTRTDTVPGACAGVLHDTALLLSHAPAVR